MDKKTICGRCNMQQKIESGVQLFSRINQRPILDGINPSVFPNGGPFPNQIIEIVGERDLHRNTFIIDFIVRCILPVDIFKECRGCGVILIITDFKINIFQIVKATEKFINSTPLNKESKYTIIENALKNLILLKCYTPEQLEITFHHLERLIHNRASISLVIIDNIAPFYWRSRREQPILSYTQYAINNYKLLQTMLRNLQVVLIFGNREQNLKNMERFAKEVNVRVHFKESQDQIDMCITDYENDTKICVPYIKL